MDCPLDLTLPDENKDAAEDSDEDLMVEKEKPKPAPIENFEIKEKPPLKSKFVENAERAKKEEEELRAHKEVTIDDDAPDLEPYDEAEAKRQRVHAWVMVRKGERQVQETFFIEPTTGRRYEVADAPYQQIDSVFNHKNYWINLDLPRPIKDLNLEFEDSLEWEYVMMTEQDREEAIEEEDEEDNDNSDEDEEELLDMPPAWSPKLYIDREKFLNLCPNGEKTVFYKKCRVDFYAPCTQIDGLIKRITLYKDYKCLIVQEIRYYFSNRMDKLKMRIRYPYEFKLVEYYEPSKEQNYWKKLIQVDQQEREIYFYHHRNNEINKDGLIYRREIIGRKTIEKYKDREDKLVYRSVEINPEHDDRDKNLKQKFQTGLTLKDNYLCKETLITKMIQRYEINQEQPAAEQIRETIFDIEKDRVQIFYHYQKGKIVAKEEEYDRNDLVGKARSEDTLGEKEEIENATTQKQKIIHEMESTCHTQIKQQEGIADSERKRRQESEKTIFSCRQTPDNMEEVFKKILEKSIYDKARDKMKIDKKKEEEEDIEVKEKDILAPILEKLGYNQIPLSYEQAIDVKNEALKRLKERLLTRAEIIQKRLESETKALEEAFNDLKKKGDHTEDEDHVQYERKVAAANFKIEILTERAAQHYRNSLNKFTEMDQLLTNDPRLSALKQKDD